MTFKSLTVGLCAALTVSLSHAEHTYSVVHGQNLDLYYDAAAFGSDVTANGDSFFFKNHKEIFSVQGDAYVVAHKGVALYGSYNAQSKGNYEVWYGQYGYTYEGAYIGYYYDRNMEPIPYQKNNYYGGTLQVLNGDTHGPVRPGTFEINAGGSADWNSDKAEFGRINMSITLAAWLAIEDMAPPVDYGYLHVDGFSFNFKTVSAVPEPETYAMLLGGLALVASRARRRKS